MTNDYHCSMIKIHTQKKNNPSPLHQLLSLTDLKLQNIIYIEGRTLYCVVTKSIMTYHTHPAS